MTFAIGLIVAVLIGLLLATFSGIVAMLNKATHGKINNTLTNLFKDENNDY